jgi:hypothetical protein
MLKAELDWVQDTAGRMHNTIISSECEVKIAGCDITLAHLSEMLLPSVNAVEAFDKIIFSTGHFLLQASLQQKVFLAGTAPCSRSHTQV